MEIDNKFSYLNMQKLTVSELQETLGELKQLLEKRISSCIDGVTHPNFVKSHGAIDNLRQNDAARREAYFNECEKIVKQLNRLGHDLKPLDLDSDINFDNTGVGYGTSYHDFGAKGLDIEFFPKSTSVIWVVSPRA